MKSFISCVGAAGQRQEAEAGRSCWRENADQKTSGELGYSAEWRKSKLTLSDIRSRTPVWRRYACESFCDTAAWLYSALSTHEEFTLGRTARVRRRGWFREYIGPRRVSI